MSKTIVLLRSGRHLHTAVRALKEMWPGCRLIILSQPGTERILDQVGIAAEDQLIYGDRKFFSPLAVARSESGRKLRRRGFNEVAVLWTDPAGKGHANVNRTALLLSPKGFLAVTPEGSVLPQQTLTIIARETRRALWSVITLMVINLFLYFPAAFLRIFKR